MSSTRWFRWMLPLVLLLIAPLALAQPTATEPDTVKPVSRPDAGWQKRHQSMNERVAQGNVDLVLIGDSITHGWEGAGKEAWQEFYGNRNAVNLGIGGDRTQHVLWRLQNGNLQGIHPKLAVIMIGTNNSRDNEPEEIAEGIEAIVDFIQEKTPETKILLLAIFPRGPNADDPLRQTNVKTNEIIQKLADGDKVVYKDIGDVFLEDDGTLSREVMPDLLHLNAASYRLWAEAIEPEVAKVMGERAAAPVAK